MIELPRLTRMHGESFTGEQRRPRRPDVLLPPGRADLIFNMVTCICKGFAIAAIAYGA